MGGEPDPLLVVTEGAPGLIAGADPRRNGDDSPMTSLSDGLGPQKDPNSGRTRVESGPAGTHRPTTRRGSGIPTRRRRSRPVGQPAPQAGDGGAQPRPPASAHRLRPSAPGAGERGETGRAGGRPSVVAQSVGK